MPLHCAAGESGAAPVVEKFVEWGGDGLLEAQEFTAKRTPLYYAAANDHLEVVEWILKRNPDLLKIGGVDGKTPLNIAKPKAVAVMVAVAGTTVMELLTSGKSPEPHGLSGVVPGVKRFLKDGSESPGLDTLRWCSVFRQLMQSRPKDSLADDLMNIADWQEAFTAFCADTDEAQFQYLLGGKEKEWFALLESAEPLQVVIQANSVAFVTCFWRNRYTLSDDELSQMLSPRIVFFTRALSMLLMVAFVLLHIQSIKEDSGVMLTWLWGTVLTGVGFILLETFQAIRLKASYWADSWNIIDFACSLSIAGFIAIHFAGWSSSAEMSSGIVIALGFALRLLQTASLHPAVGPLILAILRMLSDISIFLFVYLYILMVFAGMFTLLSSDGDSEYFGNYGKAMLTLFYAGLGDFNAALDKAIESHDTVRTVLLFIYVVLSSIIL
ncbi:unnamed protein product [Vitrella brassicaformis CCMP3155]|uniref:Ion transport domain-containing protein n=1 Tax=Vitrella brassicaformis (strain CCMP3155) TaxID=1169540 RepID=A0A0G4ETN4_VITBC|nr:unnamed protein product [Vitrella brassicaformis CCMP3155]|eukprot:CEM01024.1 unnamed protein product [Vitrella brassicaformis CCMP3155]